MLQHSGQPGTSRLATSRSAKLARHQPLWAALTAALVVPVAIAATSPLLAWRQPVYITAGFAGIFAMALLIEGTMGTLSKNAICALVLAAAAKVIVDRWTWSQR